MRRRALGSAFRSCWPSPAVRPRAHAEMRSRSPGWSSKGPLRPLADADVLGLWPKAQRHSLQAAPTGGGLLNGAVRAVASAPQPASGRRPTRRVRRSWGDCQQVLLAVADRDHQKRPVGADLFANAPGARGATHCRLLNSLPVFCQPVFGFLQSERKLGTRDAGRNSRPARDDAEASMMRALADFFQSISLGLSEASDMLFLRIAHGGTPEPVQLSLHGMPVSCAKEPCVTGDDDFGSALLRWEAAVLRIVG